MEMLLGFKMGKLGLTWNTEQKLSPKYWITSQYGILIMRSIGHPPPLPPVLFTPRNAKKKNTFPTSTIYGHLCKADNWFCPFADNEIYWASPPSHPSSLLPEMPKKNTFPTSIIYGHLCKADNWFCPFADNEIYWASTPSHPSSLLPEMPKKYIYIPYLHNLRTPM